MAPEPFDSIMTSLDAPMAVVTAAEGDERAGCLVGFHSQSSIEPPRYCVWLSKANRTFAVALRSTHLGVHLLTDRDGPLAELFGSVSGDEVDKFALVDTITGPGDVPLLAACRHRMVVRRTALLDEGGDHVCVVTEPVDVVSPGPFAPLRLSRVAGLVPGHHADEGTHLSAD
jgi:flavin reductase (DIM6/NTAB) family NADH-FMN oxidoreductase RutF